MIPNTRKEALAGGYKRYSTGVACVHGHITERRALTGECLACRAAHLVEWRKRNPIKVKQHNATQYENHTQKIKDIWEQRITNISYNKYSYKCL